MNIDSAHLSSWVGSSESRTEGIGAAQARGLAATLNREKSHFEEGDLLPPGWQWLYFLPSARQEELGTDGHPKLGGFLPPIPLPRRMWAAGRMSVHQPLRIGDEVTRTSTIKALNVKEGRSGTLIFLTLLHELVANGVTAISEEQDLVYRAQPEPGQQPAGKPAPLGETWCEKIQPDPTLLFRYSALTFNAHRIHYDREYATTQEHYPALVVQGPLIATLLLELIHSNLPDKRISRFSFRAIHPAYDSTALSLCGKADEESGQLALWSKNAEGILTMEATAS